MTSAVLLACVLMAQAQQRDPVTSPSRDNQAAAAGTASIVGTIVTDTEPARPVRRAVVDINQSSGTFSKTLVTDDNGRFAALRMPPGRYLVRASKRGWVATGYGTSAFGRGGTSLALADGQRETISIKLAHGAVISGTLLDETGQPPPAVGLYVMQYTSNSGERRLSRGPSTSYGPDERGQYRIFGLAPGEYYVVAAPLFTGVRTGSDLHLTSDVDVQQAMNAIHTGPTIPITDVPQRSVSVAPVYYPGANNAAQATPVTVRAGEERTGVDFIVSHVASVHIQGTVTGVDGAPSSTAVVTLVNAGPDAATLGLGPLKTARTAADGTFSFAEVTPGNYVLSARSGAPQSWAQSDVDVQGEDVRGVSIALQDAFTVSGTVRLDGTSHAPPLTSIRVSLAPYLGGGGVVISSNTGANATEDGHFAITGVSPGRYRLTANLPGGIGTWTIRSSTIGGQDALDTPVDVRQGVTNSLIVLTDQVASLSGHARPGSWVFLFSTNPAQWDYPSRRTLGARVEADGLYMLRAVPAGEYYIATVGEIEQGQRPDPAFLQSLAPAATKITIAEGEKKTFDLRAGGS